MQNKDQNAKVDGIWKDTGEKTTTNIKYIQNMGGFYHIRNILFGNGTEILNQLLNQIAQQEK